MRRLLVPLLIAASLSACQKLDNLGGLAAPAPASMAPAEARLGRAEPQAQAADQRSQYLAYEHSIQLDAEEQKVAALHEAARAACAQDVANHCVVLQSSVSSGRAVSASLQLRAKAEGVRKIIALLAQQGGVINQSTRAEDLVRPIGDAEKKLAMLTDYRTRLESLREKAGANIDALIKVNQQLAEVQGQIEAMTGQRAHLLQRVETETLAIRINSVESRAFFKPVAMALSGFGREFSTALAGAITAVAYLVPFGALFLIFMWVLLKLWRRWRKPRAGT